MKYFFKLKTNEKIMCTREELDQYLHNTGGDFVTVKTPHGWVSFFRDNVLLAGAFEDEKEIEEKLEPLFEEVYYVDKRKGKK